MSTSKNVIWIDDNSNRKRTADDMRARFEDVHNEDVAPVIGRLLKGPQPRLVIIDHILDKTSADTNPAFRKGSTIAEAIKEKWPSCPVIGITSANNLSEIDVRTKRTYEELFPFDDFSKYLKRINIIARDFAAVAKVQSSSRRLIELLKPPSAELGRLNSALADDLKLPKRDASTPSRMYRWVGLLMDRPGFLLDDLWSATLLGLNETGFGKVEKYFRRAQYKGIFVRPDESRWWSSHLSELLYKKVGLKAGELSWHAGRRLPNLKNEHFSSCHYCHKDFPETVAFLDERSKERRAMHLKCTILHPLHQRELYFEDIRIMRGR